MQKYKWLSIALASIILVGLIAGGYFYFKHQDNIKHNNEIMNLNTSFIQQYGSKVTIKQMVAPQKVYAALWIDADGIDHVSWNIGGVWAVVWSATTH